MSWMIEARTAVQTLFETGGDVLWPIAAVTFVMWTLILERLWYFARGAKEDGRRTVETWRARRDRTSWTARQVRRLALSELAASLERSIPMIKALVAVCPLLGLLGTVTGMIEVFDVMSIAGSGNPRAMAAGVSRATIPTMAGMVAALSGLVLSVRLERFAREEAERVSDRMGSE